MDSFELELLLLLPSVLMSTGSLVMAVAAHEFAHALAARAVGIRVLRVRILGGTRLFVPPLGPLDVRLPRLRRLPIDLVTGYVRLAPDPGSSARGMAIVTAAGALGSLVFAALAALAGFHVAAAASTGVFLISALGSDGRNLMGIIRVTRASGGLRATRLGDVTLLPRLNAPNPWFLGGRTARARLILIPMPLPPGEDGGVAANDS